MTQPPRPRLPEPSPGLISHPSIREAPAQGSPAWALTSAFCLPAETMQHTLEVSGRSDPTLLVVNPSTTWSRT